MLPIGLPCLPPSYNFIFTTDHRFLIRFRPELDGGHSINFSIDKLRYMRRWNIVHKYTFHFETGRLGFEPCKESLVHKITIVSLTSSTLNGPIMVWSIISAHIITLLLPCSLLFATDIFELDKIHPLANLSGPSNETQDFSMKITLTKLVFMYPLIQLWYFKIFALIRGGYFGDFLLQIPILILHLFSFLTLSFPAFSKIWMLVKNSCFTTDHFSLHLSWESKFLKPFPLLWVLNLNFQQLSLSFNDIGKASLISPKWTCLYSITLLFSDF